MGKKDWDTMLDLIEENLIGMIRHSLNKDHIHNFPTLVIAFLGMHANLSKVFDEIMQRAEEGKGNPHRGERRDEERARDH